MEPVPGVRAPEKVLSIADWQSPEDAVRSIRLAMIASWALFPAAFIAVWVSKDSLSEGMHYLLRLGIMVSILLLHHRVRRTVPAKAVNAKLNPWMMALGFASAIGLLAAAIANNSRMMGIAFSVLGAVFLYIFVRVMVEEARLFRHPLRFLTPNKDAGSAINPDVTASRL